MERYASDNYYLTTKMLDFQPITLKEREQITAYTMHFAPQDCGYSFGNLYAWRAGGNSFAFTDSGCLVFKFIFKDGKEYYSLPLCRLSQTLHGEEKLSEFIDTLEDTAASKGEALRLFGSLENLQPLLEKYRPGLFKYDASDDFSDYIYLRSDLASLKGKRYQPKRNHINNFIRQYPSYRFAELTPADMPDCQRLAEQWYASRLSEGQELLGYEAEKQALNLYLAHYKELGLMGGAIWVGDKLAAFTLGSPINSNTFDTHIEKASPEFETAYSVINRDFAAYLPEQYIYINREEDLGLQGLRRAKLSYHPAIILKKCIATKI